MADRDVVYVSSSPSTELQKVFANFNGAVARVLGGRGRRVGGGVGRPLIGP